MDGAVAEIIRNLGEIKLLVADELLGIVYFHTGKIIHDSAAVVLSEYPLKLRAA